MPPEPQDPQVPPMPKVPQIPFVEGDMTNAVLKASLMNLTQLMTAKAHVINNPIVVQANQGGGPQPHAFTPASRIHDFM